MKHLTSLIAALALWLCSTVMAWALDPNAVPMGKGAGIFDPNSQFTPLQERSDVVPWRALTDVKTRQEKNRILPTFSLGVLTLDSRVQRVELR